jgi:hypothetical protein
VIAQLLLRMLEKDPEARPTLVQVTAELAALRDSLPVREETSGPVFIEDGDETPQVVELPAASGASSGTATATATAPRGNSRALAFGALFAVGIAGAAIWFVRGRTPAPPPQIRIALESTPPGADVFRDGEATPIGRTPFAWSIARSPGAAELEFRLDGRKPEKRAVPLGEDARVVVALEPLEPPAPPVPALAPVPAPAPAQAPANKPHPPVAHPTKKKKKLDLERGAVIDPFK